MRHTHYRKLLLLTMAAASVSEAVASELPLPGEGECQKVTADLDGAYHQYFAVPAWNADGSKLLVVRKSDGRKKAWIIDDRGEGGFGEPKELPFDVFYFYLQWDAKDPRLLYFTVTHRDEGETELFAFDIERWSLANDGAPILVMPHGTGTDPIPQLYPPHPDGEHVLLGPRQNGIGDICIYSLKHPNEPIYRIPLDSLTHLHGGEDYESGDPYHYFDEPGRRAHRIRFTHHDDLSMWMTEEKDDAAPGRKQTWVVYPEDRTITLLDDKGGHFDFNPDGSRVAYVSNNPTVKSPDRSGMIFRRRLPDRSWQVEHVIDGMLGWSHLHWSPNPQCALIAVDAKKVKGPLAQWNNQLIVIEPEKDYRITPFCYIRSFYDSQSTHGHATFSFQADKIIFNSDYGNPRGVPDAYVMPMPVNGAP